MSFSYPLSADAAKVLVAAVVACILFSGVAAAMLHRLLFRPVNRLGFASGPFFVQGIIPAHAEDYAGILIERLLPSEARLHSVFQALEPEVLSSHLIAQARGRVEWLVDEVIGEEHALLWENLPRTVKQMVYVQVERQLPAVIDGIVEELAEHIDQYVELRRWLRQSLGQDRARVAVLYQTITIAHSRRLEYRSMLAGAVIGVAAAGAVLWGGAGAGVWFLAGLASLWLPVAACVPLVWSGSRQWWRPHRSSIENQVAELLVADLLSAHQVLAEALLGPNGIRAKMVIRHHVEQLFASVWWRPIVQRGLGEEGFTLLKQRSLEQAVPLLLAPLKHDAFRREREEVLKRHIKGWLSALSDDDYIALGQEAFRGMHWVPALLPALIGGAVLMWVWSRLSGY